MNRTPAPPVSADRTGNALVRELTVVLIVKVILLAGLWFAFFRGPSDSVQPVADGVATAIFGVPAASQAPLHPNSEREESGR